MKILAVLVPLYAILAGLGGFLLRSRELANVFDPITGLPGRGALTTAVLIAFTLANLLAIGVFSAYIAAKRKPPTGFENTFGADPIFYPILFVLIGIVWLVGTYLIFDSLRLAGELSLSYMYFLILSGLAAICVSVFAIEMFQDCRRKASYALSLVPTVFLCFWLIISYIENATNPVLISYVYRIFAIATAALAFYFTSGFIYNKSAPGKAIASYYASIYFSAVTLADDIHIGQKLIFAAIIAASLIHLSVMLRHLSPKELTVSGVISN
ncbi:MAG: hypothetical protein FWC20_06095 [Oscillospiraceae bacterium]|nr:hypothetical protein [Oscillospiraceae bacterium]MCL2278965.1 hypothetical protein [Oscillospiraceae bacterium]